MQGCVILYVFYIEDYSFVRHIHFLIRSIYTYTSLNHVPSLLDRVLEGSGWCVWWTSHGKTIRVSIGSLWRPNPWPWRQTRPARPRRRPKGRAPALRKSWQQSWQPKRRKSRTGSWSTKCANVGDRCFLQCCTTQCCGIYVGSSERIQSNFAE